MFIFWYLVFTLPVFVQEALAMEDGFLMVAQMKSRGIEKGLPFLWHGGMWADLFLFAPLMAYLISRHGREWGAAEIGYAFAAGLFVSGMMHLFVYVPAGAKFPEAHAHDDLLTPAGWVHLIYMACGLAVLALFYVMAKASPTEVAWVGAILFVHTVIGTHVPLKAISKVAKLAWYPVDAIIDLPTAMTVVGVGIAISALSLWKFVLP